MPSATLKHALMSYKKLCESCWDQIYWKKCELPQYWYILGGNIFYIIVEGVKIAVQLDEKSQNNTSILVEYHGQCILVLLSNIFTGIFKIFFKKYTHFR